MSDSLTPPTVPGAPAAGAEPVLPQAVPAPVEDLPGELEEPSWAPYVAPWMVSAAVHLGLILVGIFVVAAAGAKMVDEGKQIVVPTSFGDPALGGGPDLGKMAGANSDPGKLAQDKMHDMLRSEGWDQAVNANNVADLLKGDAGQDPLAISIGTGGSLANATNAPGEGGNLAPYGSPGGGGGGVPKSSFYGTGGAATRIVYILDHSGSMIDNFDYLQKEATRSVRNLLPVQLFSVVMVSQSAETVGGDQLERATNATKERFAEKIKEFRAEGQNDDLLPPFQNAFETAFKMKPEMIYFLTDGHFDPALMDVIERLNKDKKVKIHTLAFVNHDPSYEEQLQLLAKRNGGTYKFVSAKDLGL
jgi:hypothetical protein